MNTLIIATVAALAAQNPEGFTFNLKTMSMQVSGYAVACKETKNSFGHDGLNAVVDYCDAHRDVACIGGWLDQASGLYYYDATIIVDSLQDAIEIGKLNEQIAIFDLNTFQEVRI